MTDQAGWGQKLFWVGIGTSFATASGFALSAHDHARDIATMRELRHADKAEAMFAEWLELQTQVQAAEQLLTRHHQPAVGRGRRRLPPYELRISGSGDAEEAALFAVIAYFQKVGGLACVGRLNLGELSTYLGAAPRRWHRLLVELREHSSQPPLDGTRWEQLQQAIIGAQALARGSSTGSWAPVRLRDDYFEHSEGHTLLEAQVFNPNTSMSPVPGLCITFRGDSGEPTGHWLAFPSNARIEPLEAIQIRGRLPWRDARPPSGVRLAEDISDFSSPLMGPFPGPHGGMSEP